MSADMSGIRARLAADIADEHWFTSLDGVHCVGCGWRDFGRFEDFGRGSRRHVAEVAVAALLAEVERQAAVIDAVRELADLYESWIQNPLAERLQPPLSIDKAAHDLRAALDHDGTTRREPAPDRSQGGFCAADGATSQIPSVAFTEEDE